MLKTLAIGLDWFPEHGGGLDRMFLDLVEHAHLAGIDVRGIVAGRASIAEESDGRVRAFAPRDRPLALRAFAARKAMRRLLDDWRPDLVAAHFAAHALPALDLIDRPLVVHFQGPWSLESDAERGGSLANRVKHLAERTVYRRADRFIVLSQAFGDLLAERYGVDPARIRVVPASIDVARFARPDLSREEARERLGWPSGRPTVLCVRRLVARMGLRQLIEAVAAIRDEMPDLLVLVAGKGPAAEDLRRLIAERGVEDNVRLLGFVADDDLPLAYRAADLSIVPTQSLEGFGLITAESLAAGTPVLVTPVGGLPEAVAGLSDALVLPGTSAVDIAQALRRWANGTLPLPSEAECRAYAHEHLSWETGAHRIRAVYDEAVSGRAA